MLYSEKEIIGKPSTSFARDDHKERLLNFYRNVAHLQINLPTIEFLIIKKETTCIRSSQKVIIQQNCEGKMIGYVGIIHNIACIQKFESKEKIETITKLSIIFQIFSLIIVTRYLL